MINNYFKKAFVYKVSDENEYDLFIKKLSTKINLENFLFEKHKLENLFEINTYEYFLSFCFKSLKKWIKLNERYTNEYVIELENIINRIKLKNKLGSYELEYLNHFKAVIFAKNRNLKKLIVDFPLGKIKSNKRNLWNIFNEYESVFFNFSNGSIFEKKDGKNLYLVKDCEIYLSNCRIIINGVSYTFSIYYNHISSYKLEDGYLKIITKPKKCESILKTFYINSYDNYVLYVSLERMLQMWTKWYQ